jgi:hypothetical protein
MLRVELGQIGEPQAGRSKVLVQRECLSIARHGIADAPLGEVLLGFEEGLVGLHHGRGQGRPDSRSIILGIAARPAPSSLAVKRYLRVWDPAP